MTSEPVDTIILGQGLAGSILALALIEAGQSVVVLDDQPAASSSSVAAGLINPLAGMRFNLPDPLYACLDRARAFYGQIGAQIDATPYHPVDMLRVLRSKEQGRFHERRRLDPRARGLLGPISAPAQAGGPAAPYGLFRQTATGYVDTAALLRGLRQLLLRRHSYRRTRVDHAAIDLHSAGLVRLGQVSGRHLVFCEGVGLRDNPWFSHLPLQPDKGEILTLDSTAPLTDLIVNGAHWLIPLHDGGYRLGATHDHRHCDRRVTPQGRMELLAGLQRLFPGIDQARLHVRQHLAGVRPCTRDRQPFLGRHPAEPRLSVFNGFGARGALLIPWYAQAMARHLARDAALPGHADIGRLAY